MNVLIIDDSVENLELVSIIVESQGYSVITAENGQEGYDKALKAMPDLIITDYHIPGLSGVELIEKIRLSESIKNVLIIAMTADIYAEKSLLEAGCDAHLIKPVRRGAMIRTINNVLSTNVS